LSRSRALYVHSHVDLWNHPKTLRLARLLGISRPAAVGHIHGIWYWAATYATDGDLGDVDDVEIASAADWQGDPSLFVDALLHCGKKSQDGFLVRDGGLFIVHEFGEYMRKLLTKREADAKRKRDEREAERIKRAAEEAKKSPPEEPPPPIPPAPLIGAIDEAGRQATPGTGHAADADPVSGVTGDACPTDVQRTSARRLPVIVSNPIVSDLRERGPVPADAGARSKRANPSTGAIGAYVDAWRERYRREPVLTAQDCKAVNAALKGTPEEEREALLRAYVADDTTRLVENAHPLRWFVTDINRLRVKSAPAANLAGTRYPSRVAKEGDL